MSNSISSNNSNQFQLNYLLQQQQQQLNAFQSQNTIPKINQPVPLMQNILNKKSPELPKINEVKSMPNVKTLEEIENELLNQSNTNKKIENTFNNPSNVNNRSQINNSIGVKNNNVHLQSIPNSKSQNGKILL